MSFSTLLMPILAASEKVAQPGSGGFFDYFRYVEFDVPEEPWEWAVYGGGFALAILYSVWLYIRDTVDLNWFWKASLTLLRFGVLAALVLIALNPHKRNPKMSFRPSRVALLFDTSISMRYSETDPPAASGSVDPADQRTRAAALEELMQESQLIRNLRKSHEVSIYTFDSRLSGPEHIYASTAKRTAESETPLPGALSQQGKESEQKTLDWAETLRPRGLETRMGESLLDLIRQAGGETLSGIVLFSDGGSNSGVQPSTANEVAKASGVRLISVGVGSTQPPVNLKVASIQSPTHVQAGDPYEISAFIQSEGMQGRSVDVQLLIREQGDDGVEPTPVGPPRNITMGEDGIAEEVKFVDIPADLAGNYEFFVRAAAVSEIRESDDADNERSKAINVVEDETRVLLMAGGPMRDYRFLRNVLFRHSAIAVDVWLQTVDATIVGKVSQDSDDLLIDFPETSADLVKYDVIIAFDPDWSRISAEGIQMLADWVSEHAGGLILVAGDVHTPQLASAGEELSQIHDLYPVFLDVKLFGIEFGDDADQPWPLEFSREGREAGFLQLTEDPAAAEAAWDEFEGMYRTYPTVGFKAGATVYAYFSDPRSQTQHGQPVLLASQFYGAGRCLYLGSSEIWRLRAIDEEYFDRFWTKTIREVGQGRLKRGSTRGILLWERTEYILGQTVRVRAQLFDPQMKPLEQETVQLNVIAPGGKPMVPARKLFRDKNRPGQYVGDFRVSMPGTYRVELLIPPEAKEKLSDKIYSLLPNLESDNTRQNARLLTTLVRDTGGKYLRLDDAEKSLATLLPNRSEEFLVDEQLEILWDRDWVLYLLVGLLSVEWLARKLLKLA